MKIIVTGIAGFLGSHLAERLIKEGHEVIGIDNLIGGDEDNVPREAGFEELDTADWNAMGYIMLRYKPDIIYHCACTAYEGFSVFSPALCCKNTFQNTIGILSPAIRSGVKRFIYCSSMSRYGKQTPPFTEDMTPKPEDPYAVAKVASEEVLKQMSETHGIEYAIAVPHNIIGTRQKYDDPYRNVASIFINRMLQGKPPIIYGDGQQTRSFSFIDDCLYSLIKMLDCPSGGIYNIGPDEKESTITVKELADIIAELTGFKGEYEYLPDRPREVKHAYCSSDKIRKEFGYKTNTNIRDGLSQMVEDIKRRGTKEFKYHLPLEISKDAPKTWTGEIKM